MNSNLSAIVLVLGVLLLGMVIGRHLDNPAMAQRPEAGETLRYQISAYAGATPAGVHHGCYIVETRTGHVWHTSAGGTVQKVSGQLP